MTTHTALAILLSLVPASSLIAQETNPVDETQPAEELQTTDEAQPADVQSQENQDADAQMPEESVTDPATFAEMAAASNMFEIASSHLALEMSEDDDVRTFAQRMIDDHTAADERLRMAAGEGGLELATEVPPAEREKLDALAAADDFDAAYLRAQVEGHDNAVSLYEGFSQDGEEGPLRDFAAETLPTLEEHRAMLEDMAGA